jgi:hypothetical protein
MNRSLRGWLPLALALSGLAGCGDDARERDDDPIIVEPTPCDRTSECAELEVCRESVCVAAPSCDAHAQCSLGEGCHDGRCVDDPEACGADSHCPEAGQICDARRCRAGCRTAAHCAPEDTCGPELVCVRRPCTEVPCDLGYDCVTETGICHLRPCNGGCTLPLLCREHDDTCVECFGDNDCDRLTQFCAPDGFCANDACEHHGQCPRDTFCIDETCQRPPPCDDDGVEDNDFWPEGTLISEGEHTGYVACPYDDDFHPIVVSGDRSLTVELLFEHAVGNLDLDVLNTVGVTFARAASETDHEILTVNTFKTGIYSLRVYQPDGGTQGVPYSLRVATGPPVPVAPDECLEDGFEPNDTRGEATRLFTGRWTGPTICAGDQDHYLLPALAGELYRVCVTPSPLFGVALGLRLLDDDGVPVLEGSGLARFCVEEDLLVGGDYVTHVFGLSPTDEAAYHLELYVAPGCRLFDDEYDQAGLNNRLPGPDDPPLVMLEPDRPHELRICPNNPDYWPVPLWRRDLVTASIAFVHADGDLQMRLLRPSGTVILSSTGIGDRETIHYQAETDGTHYVRVYGEAGAMGAYTYEYSVTRWCQVDAYEDNDTPGTAAPVALGVTEGLWRCAGDDDWFSVAIPAGTEPTALEVRLEYPAGNGTLELEVVPPGGEPVAGTVDVGARFVRLESDLTTAAPYLVRVYGAETAQNTYSLEITLETE